MADLGPYRPKSFLARPEGKVGLVLSVLVLSALGYAFYAILPLLVTFVTNVLYLLVVSLVLGGVGYLVLDARFRALASYAYRAFWRALVGVVIELDPIGIMKGHIAELSVKLGSMREQLGGLRGQIHRIERVMQENTAQRDGAMQLARTARAEPEHAAAGRLQARHAVKLEESNDNLLAMRTQMEGLFRVLKKLYDASEMVLADMQSTVDIKTRERDSMKAAYSAYRSAFAILQGESEGREIYDRALEYLNEDYARKLGEIELFMDFSDGLIKGADLQNLAYDARAAEKLEAWEQRLSNGFSSTPAVEVEGVQRDPLDALLESSSVSVKSSR